MTQGQEKICTMIEGRFTNKSLKVILYDKNGISLEDAIKKELEKSGCSNIFVKKDVRFKSEEYDAGSLHVTWEEGNVKNTQNLFLQWEDCH